MDKLNCSVYEISEPVEALVSDGAVLNMYVSGSSMNPFLISRRDMVYVRACTDNDYKKLKILLFSRPDGSLVLHRIVNVLPDGRLVMKGDAQTWCETIDRSCAVAVVDEIERKGKRLKADSFKWTAISYIWHLMMPVRSPMMRVWFKIRRMKNKK